MKKIRLNRGHHTKGGGFDCQMKMIRKSGKN